LEGSICALVNQGIGDKGKGRTIRIQIRDQPRAEVNKKDEDGAREYLPERRIAQPWWKARDGEVFDFGGWRLVALWQGSWEEAIA
jgi:hypothetical protein